MLYRYLAICLLGSLPIISSAHADLIIDEDQGLALDVTAWAGEGENTSYFVVGGIPEPWPGQDTDHEIKQQVRKTLRST